MSVAKKYQSGIIEFSHRDSKKDIKRKIDLIMDGIEKQIEEQEKNGWKFEGIKMDYDLDIEPAEPKPKNLSFKNKVTTIRDGEKYRVNVKISRDDLNNISADDKVKIGREEVRKIIGDSKIVEKMVIIGAGYPAVSDSNTDPDVYFIMGEESSLIKQMDLVNLDKPCFMRIVPDHNPFLSEERYPNIDSKIYYPKKGLRNRTKLKQLQEFVASEVRQYELKRQTNMKQGLGYRPIDEVHVLEAK